MENKNNENPLLKDLLEFRTKYISGIRKVDSVVEAMKSSYSDNIQELYKKFLKYPYTLFVSKIEDGDIWMLKNPTLVPFTPYDKLLDRNRYLTNGAIDLEFTLVLISESKNKKYKKLNDKKNEYLKGNLPYVGDFSESDASRTYSASMFFRMFPEDDVASRIGYVHFDIIPFEDYDSMQLYLETRDKNGGNNAK